MVAKVVPGKDGVVCAGAHDPPGSSPVKVVVIMALASVVVLAIVLGLIPVYMEAATCRSSSGSSRSPVTVPDESSTSSPEEPPIPAPVPPHTPPPPLPPGHEPVDCSASISSTLSLYQCLKAFMIRSDEIQVESDWDSIQPTDEEASGFEAAVSSLLFLKGACGADILPNDAVRSLYTARIYQIDAVQYCVLHERNACPKGSEAKLRFCKGSPIFISAMHREDIHHDIHIQVAHPLFDTSTGEQSAFIFHAIRAKSFVAAGAHRHAHRKPSACQPAYSAFDAAHITDSLFHRASLSMLEWQGSAAGGGGCAPGGCAYLQLHGKGTTSCPDDDVFVTAATGSADFYTDASNARNGVVNTFVSVLGAGTGLVVRTPGGSSCLLVGSTNVQGRAVNGVQAGKECGTAAAANAVTGTFLHVESAPGARDFSSEAQLQAFVKALRAAVGCACAAGLSCVDGVCE